MRLLDKIERLLTGYTAEERVEIQRRWIDMKVDEAMERHTEARLQRLVDHLYAHLEEDEAAERADSEETDPDATQREQ